MNDTPDEEEFTSWQEEDHVGEGVWYTIGKPHCEGEPARILPDCPVKQEAIRMRASMKEADEE